MIEGATEAAEENGAMLIATSASTHEEQVEAIEAALEEGAQGILIVAADTSAIVPTITAAREQALVIALDTPTDPEDATDALFATDNEKAGMLIGEYAKAAFDAGDATEPIIVTLDGPDGLTVSELRHDGFIQGFGIPANSPSIVCEQPTMGSDATGKAAMEACLEMADDINIIYTVNEPVAAGAYEALLEADIDPEGIIIVSVDGGCAGVTAVKDGMIAATAQQYPLLMASLGVDAVVDFATTGTRVAGYTDTGVNLISDIEQDGVNSMDTTFGLDNCWGTP
jgi:fructose transport system substrate-binding protein